MPAAAIVNSVCGAATTGIRITASCLDGSACWRVMRPAASTVPSFIGVLLPSRVSKG
jgi:hypothetical protein